MRFLFLAAAVLLAASCNDTATVSTSDVEGAYILVSVRNEPLPARAPCSPLRIQSAHLGLGHYGRASYQVWMIDDLTGQIVTFDATGTFHVDGDVVVVNVTGGWTQSGLTATSVLKFEILEGRMLARRNVGAECDASETELYTRGVLIQL